jgi:hypothetical protein
MAKRFLTPLNLSNLASDPETGTEGDLYFNTISNTIKIYTNDVWTELQGGGGGGGSVVFSEEQPDVTSLEPGTIWIDSDGDITEATRGIGSYTRWTKLLSASATVITGNDDNNTNLFFPTGLEQVYINGVFIDKSSYTTNGTSITLDEPIYANDLIEVLSLRNIIISDIYTKEEVDGLFTEIDLSSAINTASAAAVSAITDGAPEALNTLNELAAALENNADILDLYLTQSSASSLYLTIESASSTYEPDIPYASASPLVPSTGALWIDSTNNEIPLLKVYNGSEWIAVSGTSSDSGFHPFFGA